MQWKWNAWLQTPVITTVKKIRTERAVICAHQNCQIPTSPHFRSGELNDRIEVQSNRSRFERMHTPCYCAFLTCSTSLIRLTFNTCTYAKSNQTRLPPRESIKVKIKITRPRSPSFQYVFVANMTNSTNWDASVVFEHDGFWNNPDTFMITINIYMSRYSHRSMIWFRQMAQLSTTISVHQIMC
jgi:hypothetical protein